MNQDDNGMTKLGCVNHDCDKCKARQQQEPVAWRYKIVDCFGETVWTLKTPKTDTRVLESEPLYTSPPAQRKPLTDEEIDQLLPEIVSGGTFTVITYGRAVARAIEAAHGITGEK